MPAGLWLGASQFPTWMVMTTRHMRWLPAATRVPSFRYLWTALAASICGDQIARVVITVVVFNGTGSPFLAAAAYALTYVPPLVGGPLLGVLVDRQPRRRLMIQLDLVRAGLACAMAIPGLPLPFLLLLLTLLGTAQPTFDAARASLVPDILGPERYAGGQSLIAATVQTVSLAAFPLGAVLLAWLGPQGALLVDSATFVVSACCVAAGLRDVASARSPVSQRRARWSSAMTAGAAALFGRPDVRRFLVLVFVGTATIIVPEGLAAPLAHQIGAGTLAVGFIMAAPAAGVALGLLMTGRFSSRQRADVIGVQAVLCSLALVPVALTSSLAAVLVFVALCGFGGAFTLSSQILIVPILSPEVRGRAVAFVSTVVSTCTGLMLVVVGAVADVVSPKFAVAGAGGVTLIAVCAIMRVSPWRYKPLVEFATIDTTRVGLVRLPNPTPATHDRIAPEVVPGSTRRRPADAVRTS
jgi:MFS family permease